MKNSDFRLHIDEWLSFVTRNLSAGSRKTYRCGMRQLLKYAETHDVEFSESTVEQFLDSKLAEHRSRKTYNVYLIVIRYFATWRQKKHGIESPVHNLAFLKEDPPKQRVLSQDEVEQYKGILRGMDLDIFNFLCNTGIRKFELVGLHWRDIDPDLKYITIHGKGRKRRIVPLNDTCREVLSHYKRFDNERLQISQQYPGAESYSWMLKRFARKLGIPSAGAHSCRHYFATSMIKKGVSIYKLSKILGHSSVQTTESIYVHLAPVDLLGLTDCL